MKQLTREKRNQAISRRRRWLFDIIALSIPVLFFALLELSLRVFHYGSDLSLFTVQTVSGKQYYTLNPSLKNRYFGGINFTPTPSPELFLVSKPAGTYRIFCLGESTTIGFPYWYNGAFPSFLRDRLKTIFPDRTVEVINLGITATNSYTVLDIGKDLLDYDPDLLIVYDGHNEFYGMLGAASNDRIASARWINMLYLKLVHFRTFQLARNTVNSLVALLSTHRADYLENTTLMEHVARGKNVSYASDVYERGFAAFEANLEALSGLCRDRNIPLILGTQVSNIRDQSPFVSNNSPALSKQKRNQFQQIYKRGLEFQAKGILDSAISCYRACVDLDSLYADTHYRLAQCLDARGEREKAYPEYIRARDYDELRFRTDSKFNDLIRSMDDHKHVFVADIEGVFKSLSRDSLIGHNLILEHLHPNARGNFYIAEEYTRLMHNHSLMASSEEWARSDTITDDFLWDHRHVTDLDEILAARKTEYLTSGWPFRNEPSAVSPVVEGGTLGFVAEQLARGQITWATAHSRAIDYYLQHGDTIKAEEENETIINQFPLDVASYLRLAQIYFNQKAFAKAETVLLASLQVQPTPITYRILGDTYIKEGKPGKAIPYYEELNKFPSNPAIAAENAYMLSVAYLLSSNPGPAVRILEQTIDRYPAYRPARELLSRIVSLERTHPRK